MQHNQSTLIHISINYDKRFQRQEYSAHRGYTTEHGTYLYESCFNTTLADSLEYVGVSKEDRSRIADMLLEKQITSGDWQIKLVPGKEPIIS